MNIELPFLQRAGGIVLLLALGLRPVAGQTVTVVAPAPNTAVVLALEGVIEEVQVQRHGATRSDSARTNQVLDAGDWLHAGPRSRALIGLSNRETFRVGERGSFRLPADTPGRRSIEFIRGVFYFFHRDKPADLELRTRLVNSVVRGTEFILEVEDDGTTTLHLIDGEVTMTNAFGPALELRSGESARVEPGRAPVRTAAVEAINVIQWCLYYPGVLHADEVPLTADERRALADSLAAWRDGDLLAALAKYPAGREPASDAEKIFLAALLLGVGQVEQAKSLLNSLSPAAASETQLTELAAALRKVIAAVSGRPVTNDVLRFATASAWLAESYLAQSQSRLDDARAAARQAAQLAPGFAFAHARVAELEFSFGRVPASRRALDRSLALAPRNAQALALRGFLHAAEGRIREAIRSFDAALALDGGLGNAWLGRGLCRIRRGETEAGLADLQAAATVEPQRAALRSYLGKAFHLAGDTARATNDLRLAKELDPRDPTAWLYSALLLEQGNRLNEAVRDLEHSQELNNNRRVYRSRLLLEQDQAVRAANLANLYRDAGLTDVSAREAARAVSADYANYSAHLFLADSYDALRDPRQVNLRYETAWLNEYLMANLLAPAAAGIFSPAISQQEYTRLFERDRLGLVSSTEYFSSGDWTQSGAQYGVLGNLSYSLEANYRSENGQRPNNDLELLTLSARVKWQLTPRDSVFVQAITYDAESGDVAPRYWQTNANRGLRVEENERPLLFAGWHREWAPGSHTLALVGRLDDDLRVRNTNQQTLLIDHGPYGNLLIRPLVLDQHYRSEFTIYTAELQQIYEQGDHRVVAGGRYQWGEFDTRSTQTYARPPLPFGFDQHEKTDFARGSAYAYWTWNALPPLSLIGGVTYDHLLYPENYRYAPVASGERTAEQVSPKAGVVWTPAPSTTLRAAYAQALGGVSFDQSFQLEPSQVAGFNQAYRSILPEAVSGANAAERFEIAGLSLEHRFPTRTYVGLSADWLRSEVRRTFGVVEFAQGFVASGTPEQFDFKERALNFTVNQLIGDEWSLGVRYRVADADLDRRYPQLPSLRQDAEATLHQLNFFAVFNHPSGFFARADALWMGQSNRGDTASLPGDDFWQFHVFAGYRFAQRRVEIRLGILNLTDQDYRLNPLNLTAQPPRERTFTASLRLSF